MRRQRGFTLLELILVISIFSVMSLMAYGGLNSVLNSRARVEENLNRTAALQKTYLRLREDLQQVQARGIRDGFGLNQPALYGVAETSLIEFTRGGWRNPLGSERASLERVAYRLEKNTLIRESWRVLDRAQTSEPVRLELLSDVEELRWRYLDRSRQWQLRWPEPPLAPGAAEPSPPLAVELTLETKDAGELKFLFRLGGETAPGAAPNT